MNKPLPDLFEAWGGLTIRLSLINSISYTAPAPQCAGMFIPSYVVVNGSCYPNATKECYERLRDAALAYQKQQDELLSSSPAKRAKKGR